MKPFKIFSNVSETTAFFVQTSELLTQGSLSFFEKKAEIVNLLEFSKEILKISKFAGVRVAPPPAPY